MSTELERMELGALERALPVGIGKIHVSPTVLDEGATSKVTLALPKYRHRATFVPPLHKQISKPEL